MKLNQIFCLHKWRTIQYIKDNNIRYIGTKQIVLRNIEECPKCKKTRESILLVDEEFLNNLRNQQNE